MSRLCLISIGETYIDNLRYRLPKIEHSKYAGIHILTNNIQEVEKIIKTTGFSKKIFLSYLEEKEFNYFHKFYFTLDTVIKFKETVTYVDILRTELLLRFTATDNMSGIHYVSPWGPFILNAALLKDFGCEYFEKGYWNAFLEKLINIKIDINQIIPITEQLLIVNYSNKLNQLKLELKQLELDFIDYSTNMKSVYKKPANGEGLALGYAIYKLDIPLYLLKRQTSYLI